jgi:16S rRNA (adenine1518-N6/adenine1519-N6)-dimethyltransferase
MNIKRVQLILKQLNVRPNKKLGQNFLVDENLIEKIILISELSPDDVILEIGPGLGGLTEKIASKVKKIFAIEIDQNLYSYLKQKFTDHENIKVIHGDILKIDIPKHDKIVSNIPYTITGPIFEKFFFKKQPPQGILTIERSIAERIFQPKEYKKLSRITISVNTFMNPILNNPISRNCFYPIPKIDLSIIKLEPKQNLHPFIKDKTSIEYYLKFIAGIMPYKNKDISNALHLSLKANFDRIITKNTISRVLQDNKYENNKVFQLNVEEFIEISRIFHDYIKITI